MLHYSCDFCGKHLDDKRFVAKLSMFPTFDPEKITEEDLDTDNLQAVANDINLHSEETNQSSNTEELNSSKDFRFDLCSGCYQKVLNDPLGQERLHRFDYSEN
jgi:hypothetical protein